jgi:hypothetical protein
MEREAWVEAMSKPGAPLAMDFVIRRPEGADPDKFFSEEAWDTIGGNVTTFAAARALGRSKETGRPPSSLRVTVKLAFDESLSDARLVRDNLLPWFAIDDQWVLPVEGEARNERGDG